MLRCLVALLLASAASAASTPATFLTARFKQHFDFGIEAPLSWLQDTQTNNGCNWDARAQYLSSGVHFTGGGAIDYTKTWFFNPAWNNGGHFITAYITECRQVNTVPWFTWYMLSQSDPANYSPGPAQAAPANAANAQTMNGYFTLLRQAFQECGNATNMDYPVVFHFEPDEWCHILLTGTISGSWPNQTMDPTSVTVKVNGSGFADVSGYADNLVGFGQAIKHLRDLYAPQNVILVTNPSAWDYGNTMTGTRMGNIMATCCAGWEAAVLETGDRDKGANTNPPYGNSSGVCGDFDTHIQWISDFKTASSLPVFIWQAALGNTYFCTCNQSDGHYCDNLIQTLLEGYPNNNFILRYARAGCLGWVFNAGQGFSTHAYDAKGDGVTNPAKIADNLGYTSIYADDDGGYARLRGGAYYAAPYSLASAPNAPIIVDVASVVAPAKGTATFKVKLGSAPGATTAVSVARQSGDTDVSVATPTITFSTGNWSTYQTVTLNVADNLDGSWGTALIALTAGGYSTAYVSAIEPVGGSAAGASSGSSDSHKCGIGMSLGLLVPLAWLGRRRLRRR
jgi:hypothetical protein